MSFQPIVDSWIFSELSRHEDANRWDEPFVRYRCANGGAEVGNWNEIPFRIVVSRNLFQLFHVIGVIFVCRSCENAIITMSGFTTHFHAFLRLSVLNRCKWPTGFPPSYLNFKLLPLCWPKDGYYEYTTPPCCKEGRKTSWHPLNTICYYVNASPCNELPHMGKTCVN